MNWKDYEEITKYIYETLGRGNVKIECYGNKCKKTGKSGVTHQIDVLTKHSNGIHEYETVIECKYWEDKVNKDVIMKTANIVEDIRANYGVVVSKNGFTQDAIKTAEHNNIGLIKLRKPIDEDWENRISEITTNMNFSIPEITDLIFMFKKELVEDEEELLSQIKEIDINNCKIELKEKIINLEDFIKDFNSELFKQKPNEEYEDIIRFENNAKLIDYQNNKEFIIDGINFKGKYQVRKETFTIKTKDYVHMIMEIIFEGKFYTISKNGEIKDKT